MDEKEQKSTEKPSFINKAAGFLAYPVSAAAGIYAFISSVDDKLYDTLRKNITSLSDKLNENKETFKNSIANDAKKTAEELPKFHKNNSDIYKGELEERGINSFWKKFNSLHKNQKIDSALIGFTATGIGLGVLLTIANSKGLMDKINEKEKEKNPEAQASR